MKFLITTLLALSIVGCASQPEDIATAHVSPMQYQSYSCFQIERELQRVNRRASELHASLDETADNDAGQMAMGLILFWPALFFLEGGDGVEAQEYSRLKGERDALEQSAIQKNCGLSDSQLAATETGTQGDVATTTADATGDGAVATPTAAANPSARIGLYGAIAVSSTSTFRSGTCVNEVTLESAKSCALRECGRHCKIHVSFGTGQCAAVAGRRGVQGVRSDNPQSRWRLGDYGVGDSPAAALEEAMVECHSDNRNCAELVRPVCNG